jgi:hypothetical protein
MNRKQFLVLVLALLVLGGAGLAMFWKDIAAYRATDARIGGKLLPEFKVVDVAQVRLQDAKQRTTLVRKEDRWVVEERGGYTADFQRIGELIVKLIELKVTQSEQIGESLLPRVNLVAPEKGGEGAGTLIEFKDASGKVLAGLILGRTVLKKDPLNPLPSARDGVPAGRYVRVVGATDNTVVVVSDPLTRAEANPGAWLAKDFFRAERIRTLAVGPEGAAPHWRITRDEEWGQWRFAAGGGNLDPSAAVGAVNALAKMEFSDVAIEAKPAGKPLVAVAETFDNLTYTVRIAKKAEGDDYLVNFTLAGEPPRARVPEKGEKPEDKERRDKDFAESLKRLEERIAAEKALTKWTYVVEAKAVAPLLRERAQMIAQPRKK